ncbi:O-antigen ligase family protein [Novosphingobium sediminicola]|uniref:O-antigen ligase n=1 Tax=Novosphingobium sediminicola TaxID=563162 RepID=A0A7W6G7Z8_9SPHN|nr:O-antigen ligase family protein [Novosphingobium sediminicola]MBB3956831.1 O-antigen ligase [Novosphingobium sediminicola]
MIGMFGADPAIQSENARAATTRRYWAAFCLVAYLLYVIVGLDPLAADGHNALNSDGSALNQLTALGLALLLMLTTWHRGQVAANLALSIPVLLLAAYTLMSVSWSAVPDIAIRRWGQAIISIWVLWRASAELGYARTLWYVRLTLVIVLAMNYFAVIFLDHGIHHYILGDEADIIGSWRGILNNKNVAGPICAFTVIFFAMDKRGLRGNVRWVIIVLALVFLGFSQSKSSMSGLFIALIAGLAIHSYDPRSHYAATIRSMILFAFALPLAAVFFASSLEPLVDPYAFTGRVRIWSTLILYAQDHFWTGAGYGSFWRVGDATPALSVGERWVAEIIPSGHNGYLDLQATIGYPGLVLAVLALVIIPLYRLLGASMIPASCRSLFFTVITFCAWNNLAESQFIDGKAVDQLFLTIAIALIGLAPLPYLNWKIPAFSRGR